MLVGANVRIAPRLLNQRVHVLFVARPRLPLCKIRSVEESFLRRTQVLLEVETPEGIVGLPFRCALCWRSSIPANGTSVF